jgi:hypothetical protein
MHEVSCDDCGLHGCCAEEGTCVCHAGWTGAKCDTLASETTCTPVGNASLVGVVGAVFNDTRFEALRSADVLPNLLNVPNAYLGASVAWSGRLAVDGEGWYAISVSFSEVSNTGMTALFVNRRPVDLSVGSVGAWVWLPGNGSAAAFDVLTNADAQKVRQPLIVLRGPNTYKVREQRLPA